MTLFKEDGNLMDEGVQRKWGKLEDIKVERS